MSMDVDEFVESMDDLRRLIEVFQPENDNSPLEGWARQEVAKVVQRMGNRLTANAPKSGALLAELGRYRENWTDYLKRAKKPTALPEHRLYKF